MDEVNSNTNVMQTDHHAVNQLVQTSKLNFIGKIANPPGTMVVHEEIDVPIVVIEQDLRLQAVQQPELQPIMKNDQVHNVFQMLTLMTQTNNRIILHLKEGFRVLGQIQRKGNRLNRK